MAILAATEAPDGTLYLTVEGVAEPVPIRQVGANQWRNEYVTDEERTAMTMNALQESASARGHTQTADALLDRIGLGALKGIER